MTDGETTNQTPQIDESQAVEERVLGLKREKRARKTAVTRIRHNIEKLCVHKNKLNCKAIEREIETLWEALERGLSVMDELCSTYIKSSQSEAKLAILTEQDNFEAEVHQAVEKAQHIIREYMGNSSQTASAQEIENTSPATTLTEVNPPNPPSSPSNPTSTPHKLKPLTVPVFNGDKTRFEDFWALFASLVDEGNEPVNIKMARLRQSLSGNALDAIRGLGVTEPEYDEAKEILKAKFGGQRRQLQAYLDQLENMPALKHNDIQAFEKFADLVRVTVVKLQAEERSGELGDGALHSLLVRKLAERQVENYSRWLSEQRKERSVLTLRDWLKEEVYIRVEATEMAQGVDSKPRDYDRGKHKQFERGYRPRTLYTSREQVKNKDGDAGNMYSKPPCVVCGGNHGVWSCKNFSGMTVPDRWKVAKEKRLCFRCLASNHLGKDCTRSKTCTVQGCKKSHHNLLHEDSKRGDDEEKIELPREGAGHRTHTSTNHDEPAAEALSLRTIPVWVKANGRKVKINAILDDASNETFLNEQVAGALGLQEPYKAVKVHVLNDQVETFQSMPVKVMIEGVDGQYRKEISAKTCPQNVTGTYKVEDWSKSKGNWPHLQGCDFATPAKDGLVDLLIGVDNADLLYSRADVRGEPGSPIARLGPLGWSCIGSTVKRQESTHRTHTIRTLLSRNTQEITGAAPCCQVDESVKRFWEIESCGTENFNSRIHTVEETEALNKLKESVSYNSANSRYKITVPWKDNRPTLPDNREQALIRLSSTEKKLKKDHVVSKEYQQTIESYMKKGYLRRVPESETIPPQIWYLPHFPIIRMDKTTTKVRIVFDCSAKANGVSLNDLINPGPKLQRELFDVLLRFRRNQVALACDIKEMYLQVEIKEKDRPFFRVLWRDLDCTKEPDVYEFTRVVFGKNSAPMEAQFIAQENARRHEESYPLAAETVLKSTYMDDSIDSVETDESGVELYHQLRALWAKAGMYARKWVSNSEKVMAEIPIEDQAEQLTIADNKDLVVKTLGIEWDSKSDTLNLPTSKVSSDIPMTKRNVLKKIAAVFDPLGFISPFVMVAKVILQELWARGYEWDEIIVDEIANRIAAWFVQLQEVAAIQIPRCLCAHKQVASREVVTFVDASLKAYGTVVYLRCMYEDGSCSSRLIASKSKVAPLTPITVPRLELMAAILGLRLTQNVLQALSMSMQDATFYSDSTDVLWWIRGCG